MDSSTPQAAADSSLTAEQVAQIEATAAEARVRRAPRFAAFVMAGVVIGAIVGIVASLFASAAWNHHSNLGFVTFFTALGFATVGVLAGAVLAVRADRRS